VKGAEGRVKTKMKGVYTACCKPLPTGTNYMIPPSLALWRAAMMGVLEQPQNSLFHFGVKLDKRIRSNHPLRKVNELIDFHFVYDEAISFYGHNGN
jgi:hypothetical protein